MNDFPPNPEDGEHWLPSDVFHEIASTNLTLGANTGAHTDAAHFLQVQPTNDSTTTSSLPCATPNLEVSTNWIGSTANGAPNVNNHSSYASWNGAFQLFPGSIHFFNPFTPTQTQGFENYYWPLQCTAKCGGTGVFLPRSVESAGKCEDIVQEGGGSGTGVFLNHQVVIATRKKKKSKLLKM